MENDVEQNQENLIVCFAVWGGQTVSIATITISLAITIAQAQWSWSISAIDCWGSIGFGDDWSCGVCWCVCDLWCQQTGCVAAVGIAWVVCAIVWDCRHSCDKGEQSNDELHFEWIWVWFGFGLFRHKKKDEEKDFTK